MADPTLITTRAPIAVLALLLCACGGSPPARSAHDAEAAKPNDSAGVGPSIEPGRAAPTGASDNSVKQPGPQPEVDLGGDFKRLDTRTAKETHGASLSKLKPTKTEALLKFVVVDKGEGEPIPGVVVSLTGPDGNKYYTEATDAVGYAEVLVPAGKQYEVVYVSLKGKDIGAALNVENKERYTLKLTLRYQGYVGVVKGQPAARLVLQGVEFDTGKATIRPSSFARLDGIVEYLAHKQDARIEISGHTDNVGVPANNKTLSTKRAEACRDYLVGQGIDAARVQAVGYGDERPIASNDTAEGRQTNRRIEAEEL